MRLDPSTVFINYEVDFLFLRACLFYSLNTEFFLKMAEFLLTRRGSLTHDAS